MGKPYLIDLEKKYRPLEKPKNSPERSKALGLMMDELKKEGDKVSSGDVLAEVETDKATMELESYQDGTLLHIGVKEHETVPVDGVIAIIGDKGEDISGLLKEIESGQGSNGKEEEEKSEASQESI